MRRRTACLATILAALAVPAGAHAAGGRVAFDGGTAAQQAQVRAALDASAFDFSLVPATVVVHIRRGVHASAAPGHVWLSPRLLDSGSFAWGVVQHEFAHQVDWFLLGDDDRNALRDLLGGSRWCFGGEAAEHDDNACERFATALAWAYWPSSRNVFDPAECADETWLKAAQFRGLLATRLGIRTAFGVVTLR